jgi:hypothetical protein
MKTAAAWLRSLPIGLLDRHQGLAPVHARRKCLCRSVHSEMRASGHQHDLPAWRLPTARQRSMHGLQTDRIPQLSGTTVGYLATNRASAPGRVWGVTNGRFVEAKQEKRCLAVRLLCGDPAGRFGSAAIDRRQWEQSFAEPRHRVADRPTRPTAAERQVPRYSGQPPEELANGRFRRPPTFAGQIRTAAGSLERVLAQRAAMPAHGRTETNDLIFNSGHQANLRFGLTDCFPVNL